MEALGNGANRCFIYDRFARTRLLELVTTGVEWNRELCDISRANLTVGAQDCVPEHDLISEWAHSLVVYRDNDRVWEGPLRKVTHLADRAGLAIVASDVLGWTERRANAARSVAGSPVTAEMTASLHAAFDPDDPNVLAYLNQIGEDGPPVDRDLVNGAAYVSAAMRDLVGGGGRFTALGRSILTWGEQTIIGRTRTLVPERHLLTDVNVVQDGDGLATYVIARDDAGGIAGAEAPSGPVDPFYGLVTVITTAPGAVAQYAASTLAASYPSRLTIEVPGGAALSCDAPFPIEQLVPGVLIPVETTTATGKQVSATMQLTSVKVTQQAGQDEKVAITVAPISTAVA